YKQPLARLQCEGSMRPTGVSDAAFVKMHGAGNDCVIIDQRIGIDQTIMPDQAGLRWLSDRRFGVGCDQIIVLRKPQHGGAAQMMIFNSDGTVAQSCGNATRCVARYLFDQGLGDPLVIEAPERDLECRKIAPATVTVDMGAPCFACKSPLAIKALPKELPRPFYVSMGNPHCVFVLENESRLDQIDIAATGRLVQGDGLFPDGVNVGFVAPLAAGRYRLRVFERGAGLTLACGSGACAAFAVLSAQGFIDDAKAVHLMLDGGELKLGFDDCGHIWMEGQAHYSFTGRVCSGSF
ncbi:MAG: diaminopimelate epimerase, partial [Pseudomonadota bacterium]